MFFKPKTLLIPKVVLYAVGQTKPESTMQNAKNDRAGHIEEMSWFHYLII